MGCPARFRAFPAQRARGKIAAMVPAPLLVIPQKIRRIRSARLSRLPLAAATASEPAICSGSRSRVSTSSTRADPSGTENPKPGRSLPPGKGHRKPLTIMAVNHMIIPWRRAVTPPGNQGGAPRERPSAISGGYIWARAYPQAVRPLLSRCRHASSGH